MFKKGRWPLNFACPKFNKGHFRTQPGSGLVFFIVFIMLRMSQLLWPRWQGCSASPAGGLRGFGRCAPNKPAAAPLVLRFACLCSSGHAGRVAPLRLPGGCAGLVAALQTNPLQLPGCFASHQGRETFSTQLRFHELQRVGLVAALQNQTNSAAAHF